MTLRVGDAHAHFDSIHSAAGGGAVRPGGDPVEVLLPAHDRGHRADDVPAAGDGGLAQHDDVPGGGCDLEILGPDRAALQSDPDAPHPLSGAGCDERRRVSVRLRRGPPWDLRSGWRGAHAVPPIRSCPQRSTRRGHSRAASSVSALSACRIARCASIDALTRWSRSPGVQLRCTIRTGVLTRTGPSGRLGCVLPFVACVVAVSPQLAALLITMFGHPVGRPALAHDVVAHPHPSL